MNKTGFKVLRVFLIVFLLVYVARQFYVAVYNPFRTDMVTHDSSFEGLELDTYFVRDEILVPGGGEGYLGYAVEDGGRVANGGVIAAVYSSPGQVTLSRELEDTERRIQTLRETENYTEYNSADLEGVNKRIAESLRALLRSAGDGVLTDSPDAAEGLERALNRKNIITGEETDFSALIESLERRAAELRAASSEEPGYLRAESSGYFMKEADGFESVFPADDLASVDVAAFDAAAPAEVPEGTVGKIVSDYEWHILAKIGLEDSFELAAGEEVTFKTGLPTAGDITATVENINREGNSEYAVALFSCSVMNRELALSRRQRLTLVTASYDGLRVPKSAVRVVDGTRGVYTYSGSQVRFVPITVLYTGDTFVICDADAGGDGSGRLRLYDEIIVKGKGLYDGKIVD